MKKTAIAIFLAFFVSYCFASDVILDLNGRKIIVHDNFSWEYQNTDLTRNTAIISLVKNAEMDKQLASKTSKFVINYDSSVWDSTKSTNASAEFSLQNKDSTGFGMLIYDGLPIPLPSMEEILIKNAKNLDENARLIGTQKCTVNGTEGELVTYTAQGSGLQFTLYTFVASKETGTVQFTFYTLSNLFEKLKPSFLDAISGIEF